MTDAIEIARRLVVSLRGKSAEAVIALVNAELSAEHKPKKIEEYDRESRLNPDCANGSEFRIAWRVNHGDGTYSDPWWGDWTCY